MVCRRNTQGHKCCTTSPDSMRMRRAALLQRKYLCACICLLHRDCLSRYYPAPWPELLAAVQKLFTARHDEHFHQGYRAGACSGSYTAFKSPTYAQLLTSCSCPCSVRLPSRRQPRPSLCLVLLSALRPTRRSSRSRRSETQRDSQHA
jgi:hypothetical protein